MHSFELGFRKALIITCVLLVCASLGFARTRKPAHHAPAKTPQAAATPRPRTATIRKSGHSKARKKHSVATVKKAHRGQQAIDDARVFEIQDALIRAKYLDGEPTGVWDQRTKTAMSRFQNDQGWQAKVVPDSRALIKLGLGPNHEDVINPETSLMRMQTTDTARQQLPIGGNSTPQR